MAKLARVMQKIDQRLARIEKIIVFLLDEEGKAKFAMGDPSPPKSRAELKASKPAEEGEPVEGAIASESAEEASDAGE